LPDAPTILSRDGRLQPGGPAAADAPQAKEAIDAHTHFYRTPLARHDAGEA
jgi:hypothetical protein